MLRMHIQNSIEAP